MEKIIVLSDLHLWGNDDPLYRALLKFMDEQLNPGDKFFIVGDLFDLFIGSKAIFTSRFKDLIEKIKSLGSKDVEVFYIEGNHDFHLENIFDDCPNVKIYSDLIHYDWDGKKLLFCHGDKINWKDIGYQLFRFTTRSLFLQCLIEIAPGALVDRIGQTMSKASRGYHYETNNETVRMFRNYACDQISQGYDIVVMGHSHFLDDIRFRVGTHQGQYVNVGYPRKNRKFLVLNQGDKFFQLLDWEDLFVKPVARN